MICLVFKKQVRFRTVGLIRDLIAKKILRRFKCQENFKLVKIMGI